MSLLLALLGSPPASVSYAALSFDDDLIAIMRKNIAGQNIAGQMNSRTTGDPLTTAVSVFVTGDGGAQGASGGTVTHEGNGHWTYAPTQAETNFNHVAFTFVHATGVVKTYNVFTVGYDPQDAAGLGLSRLDAAVSTRMATYTQPAGFLAATFPAGTIANTTNITAGTITTATNVTTVNGLAANVITAASIAAAAITNAKFSAGAIDAAAIATDAFTAVKFAAGSLNGKGDWLTAASYTAPDNAGIAAIKADTAEIHKLQGLAIASPLVVNNDTNTRTAGSVSQSVVTVGNVTTVTRLP